MTIRAFDEVMDSEGCLYEAISTWFVTARNSGDAETVHVQPSGGWRLGVRTNSSIKLAYSSISWRRENTWKAGVAEHSHGIWRHGCYQWRAGRL